MFLFTVSYFVHKGKLCVKVYMENDIFSNNPICGIYISVNVYSQITTMFNVSILLSLN
jgi:hypothetical protein